MPSDAGAAAQPSSLFSNLLTGTLDAVKAAADVATELSSFTKFQKRVDDLIRDLKGSEAGPGKVGHAQLARRQFGGGDGAWSEATGLHTAYETVISELETLSKLLSDSIEGMGIAVMASHKGYENVDVDVRNRMAAISAETTEHYGGAYNPSLPKTQEHAGQAAAQPEQPAAPPAGDTGGSI
ncbi:hypothetical protein ABZ920_23715 [Streptomyces sp. NPDC046831]|uniref:hypothetical protein n=1 Tax=Streptomyces sp. NPDC046831 TaxID=3154805 RepID=UPI0033E1CAD5